MFRLFITPRIHGLQLHFEHMTLISRAPNCCPNLKQCTIPNDRLPCKKIKV
uniref:Uncharacterized protein n=1 Tax=Anguilla anguilla TaxID=7936 RepID=A0A0E9TLJ3_ANGAN